MDGEKCPVCGNDADMNIAGESNGQPCHFCCEACKQQAATPAPADGTPSEPAEQGM